VTAFASSGAANLSHIMMCGIRDKDAFARRRAQLDAFPDEPIVTADYERAAEHFKACRARGLQGSNTEFLLCAIAQRHRMAILTTDQDFSRYAKVIPLVLHPPVS
jgi:predicted nucleic acid-binding protein